MKLTKSRLKQIIKEEVLKEISGTVGGTAAIKRQKSAKAAVQTKRADKSTKKSAWDTAKSTYNTKKSTYDTKSTLKTRKQSIYNTKDTARGNLASQKYRKAHRGSYLYSATLQKGYSLNPAWTSADNDRTTALNNKNTADSEYDTAASEKSSAESDRDTKETNYNKALKDLSSAEKAEREIKAKTGFGFGAGGGGRGAGKGGTAKKGKKESLFNILGRDLIKELKDLKKYNKK